MTLITFSLTLVIVKTAMHHSLLFNEDNVWVKKDYPKFDHG